MRTNKHTPLDIYANSVGVPHDGMRHAYNDVCGLHEKYDRGVRTSENNASLLRGGYIM